MDIPSSSRVTERRKRIAHNSEDDDSLSLTPLRKVRGTKKIGENDLAPNPLLQEVKEYVDEIVTKRKVGALNCFEYKSPLELFGIEKMLEANAPISEMANVLDSAQVILAYRVDRLHHDVRQVDAVISSGDMIRSNDDNEIRLNVENRKAKKKMAITDGMNGMSDYLNQMDDDDFVDRARRGSSEDDEITVHDDVPNDENTGQPKRDPKAHSKDVDLFLRNDTFPEEILKNLALERAVNFQADLFSDSSALVSSDETAHDIKDASIDWLKTNPTFQKATKGSIDNEATSFHSLNQHGVHSASGRTLLLHPRIIDKNADDRFYTADVSVSLANNTRALLENALAKKPHVLDNYLMLEVKDRPVIGRYKIMANEVKKSNLPLAESSRERDLANLTFAEMNRDVSMIAANLPLAPEEPEPTSSQSRSANDEYTPPSFERLALEESLIGRIPMDLPETDELAGMFDEKLREYHESDSLDSKVWQNGLRAEEWGVDNETAVKTATRQTVAAGVEGWIKATDLWTNYDVVKMVVNREARMQLDENAFEEQDSCRNTVPEIGKSLFLVKSDEFMSNYPADRLQEIRIVGEELDVMKMTPGVIGEEEEDDVQMAQIQEHILKKKVAGGDEPEPEEMDFDAGAYEVEFDDRLAAPAESDEVVDRAGLKEDNVAEILFAEPIAEIEEVADARAYQRNIEDIALGADEVPELMTAGASEDVVGPSAEMRDEIRNIGKHDNAHWIPPEQADHGRQIVQRKKREKKAKSRKATVEEYVHYFRDVPEEEREREVTAAKCSKIGDERGTFLTEQHIYLNSLGTENKPHVALDLSLLTTSGLFFKVDSQMPHAMRPRLFQKTYGKVKLERVKGQRGETSEVFGDDSKGNQEADCLNWLLSFSGFRCMENPEAVADREDTDGQRTPPMFQADDVEDDGHVAYFDDEYDRYNPKFAQELAAAQMGTENQRKLAYFSNSLYQIQSEMFAHRGYGEYDDDDDEFDDSFDRQTVQAKNLDAAKHKKCLADILNNDTLSMPSIQYALEQLNLNQTVVRNNSTFHRTSSAVDRDVTRTTSPTPTIDAETTLTTVFDYHSPGGQMNHDVDEIMKALTEMPDYVENETAKTQQKKAASSEYGTANTENRKVKINGLHTLLSLALSMPPKMGESVKPSSIVSFVLHVANENNLKIVQDRSKRTWMSDFVVLNQNDGLPTGLKMGKIDEQDEFWRKNQDPDAIEATAPAQHTGIFDRLTRPKATAARRGRVALQGPSSSSDLGAIAEEDEMDV